MADDLLDGMDEMFADSAAIVQPEPQAAPEPVQTPEPTAAPPAPDSSGQPRAADGTFAPKVQTPPEPAPQPVADLGQKAPISREEFKGMLDERDKRQKAEARLADLERQLQQRQPQTDIPAIQNDPDAIARYVQSARTGAVFDFSEKVARKQYGDETVQSAMDWGLQRAQQNPAFAAEYTKQEHPIEWAVKQHKRELILAQIGDDPDAFIEARIAARLNGQGTQAPQTQAAQPSQAVPPQLAVQSAPQVPQPPRSIANATAAGGGQNVVPPAGEFAMADELYNR